MDLPRVYGPVEGEVTRCVRVMRMEPGHAVSRLSWVTARREMGDIRAQAKESLVMTSAQTALRRPRAPVSALTLSV